MYQWLENIQGAKIGCLKDGINVPVADCCSNSSNPPSPPCGNSMVGNSTPGQVVAKMTTKYRPFLGSPKADTQTNLIYVGLSAVGAFVGYMVPKKKKDTGALIGGGLGLASGFIINSITKK